jgi:hypothetical protein
MSELFDIIVDLERAYYECRRIIAIHPQQQGASLSFVAGIIASQGNNTGNKGLCIPLCRRL